MPHNVVYCSTCGTCLPITRKALPKYSTIINMIDQHTCPEVLVELVLTENPPPSTVKKEDKKFASSLDDSSPKVVQDLDSPTLSDKRAKELIRSTAPTSLLNAVKKGNL
jgi:hypothetical protein